MTQNAIIQLAFYFIVVLILFKPVGIYLAHVFQGERTFLDKIVAPLECLLYRLCGVDRLYEMTWRRYFVAIILFSLSGIFVSYTLFLLQGYLGLNPMHFGALTPELAFNTAVSYVTNTNWQAYSGETTMSYLSDMLALTVQNFVSAATGIAVMIVLIRSFTREEQKTLGNFWVDLIRVTLYVLLPLTLIVAFILMSQGVIQNLQAYVVAHTLGGGTQTLPMGPAASQIAIKQLGTNGGGFFNANSAHPYENPTPFSSFIEVIALLLIPTASCYAFGRMIRNVRQGVALLMVMTLIFIPLAFAALYFEQHGNPLFHHSVNQLAGNLAPGGNMEGKELRFGTTDSTLFSLSATATSTGATNAMHDSLTPLGGLIPLFLMQLSEVIYGGAGSGLYSIILFMIIAVFIAGLMVGRTPEYLGKKIEAFEMKMASLSLLLMPALVLIATAIASLTQAGLQGLGNHGAHGFTEMLYAFTSMANNNGSAFTGLNGNLPLYNLLGALLMFIGRFGTMALVLALAGSLVRKKMTPAGPGTLPTHTPFFIVFLALIIIVFAGLTFLPSLALGPIVEALQMAG